MSFRVTNAAIAAGVLASAALACSPPTPHSTVVRLDAGLCRPGAIDSGADDDGAADGGACAPTDAAADHQ